MQGRQLRLFLVDGSSSGVRYAELVNWTGQAFLHPVELYSSLAEWPEARRSGVYLVFGEDAGGRELVYIGETENVFVRLGQHIKKPPVDEITRVLFFTSKDDNLTRSHTTFLEARLIRRAKEAKRYTVTNAIEPADPQLSRPEQATMEEFLANILLVTAAMGVDVFEISEDDKPLEGTVENGSVFLFESKGAKAQARRVPAGLQVLKGSLAVVEDQRSMPQGYRAYKQRLKENGVLKQEGEYLTFTENHTFSAPSRAASVIAGTTQQGPRVWRTAAGKTYEQVVSATAATILAVEAVADSASTSIITTESPP